ncbi:MAG: EAL domain-containing protein [Pseudomonadota bacterium]|nr:EAL domain-containing protein [Pseudomonadota bacterium]
MDHHESWYRAVFEHSMEAVLFTAPDGLIFAANPAACHLFGRTEEELCKVGRPGLIDACSPHLTNFLAERARNGQARAELIFIRGDGSRFPGEASSEQFVNDQQEIRTILIVRDLTEHKKSERLLAESEEQYRLLVAAMEEGVTLQDENSAIIAFNKSAERILGLTADQLKGKTSFDPNWYPIHEDGSPFPGETHPVVDTLRTGLPHSNVIMGIHKPDGQLTWISINVQPIFKEGKATPYRVVATMHDITENKLANERIERLAHFDQLTGLPNRTLLNDRFRYALSLAQRNDESLAVMFIDLDHFKDINDSLGHNIGDQVLMEVARRLKASLREEDTLSRQGGDEYILILPDCDADGAALVASKLIEVVAQPCQIEQHELIVTPSVGITLYPHDGETLELLSKHADSAMYRAKNEGRNGFRFYTSEMQAHPARNLQLANMLRYALERHQLQLHYQPQLSLQDGHIVGVEALLRREHPEMGMVSPAEFIPIAESTGQIIQIGEWVLRTAARQLKDWMDSGMPPMIMAVNLSAVQFRQNNFPELVNHILDEERLPHHFLELELTEATAMDNPKAAINVIDKLHERGIRMSIDDFGTGYSSLSYLKQFNVYKLKIDQSFVRDITDDPEDRAIVTAIINMASSLGLQTIAEGVETASQLNFLRLKGCNEVQGYYFSKPLTAMLFKAFVARNKDARAAF